MFRNGFLTNENQRQHFNINITVNYIYHQDFSFFLEIFKNTPDKHRYFYYYIMLNTRKNLFYTLIYYVHTIIHIASLTD